MNKVDLIKFMQKKYNKMSKGHKLIAEYVIKNYDTAAFMTAAALGNKVGVSESTVVRFANALGYSGYRELQKELQELIRNKLTTVQRITLSNPDFIEHENILKDVVKRDIHNTENILNEMDYNVYHDAVNLILNARHVYILGLRSSSFLVGYLSFYLNFLLENVKAIVEGPNDVFDQLLKTKNEDVIIGISYPRYSRKTLEALDYGKERGAKIITITDSMASPVNKYSDCILIASSDMLSFVDSLVAPMSLLNALIVSISIGKGEKLTTRFEDLEKIWAKQDVYITNEKE